MRCRDWMWNGVIAGVCLCSLACGGKTNFDLDKARFILEGDPVNLDGEQVSLTDMQLKCGVDSELWDAPAQVSPDRTSAKLTAKGRQLNFGDDPVIEPAFHHPYVQVRGVFPLQIDDVSGLRDGEEKGTKVVDAKIGIKINHACFASALPVMGVKRGNFREDAPTSFAFRLVEDGWHYDKIVH